MSVTILIVDDEKNFREGLKTALEKPGQEVRTAENAFQAEEILRQENIDLVLSDLKMPGINGLELLNRLNQVSPNSLLIIMTAYGTVDTAVEAMKQGAYDYLTKPINLDQLDLLIARALKDKNLQAENVYLKERLRKQYGFENITGQSAGMEKVFDLIRQVRDSRATVLISGESGTGKELVAQAIHHQGLRRNMPFVPVHCASLAPTLLESELFGHEKGAFTGAVALKKGRFEIADGGTVFLDEVSEISPEIQVKLLRFLETHQFERVGGSRSIQVNIRLLAATNTNLEELMERGSFRPDLYYRLNVIRIHIPPLRERREDIPLLIQRFLRQFGEENARTGISMTPAARRLLQDYNWPGNVRELKNTIESMVVLAKSDLLDMGDLPANIPGKTPAPETSAPKSLNLKLVEKELIETALKQSGANKTRAAQLLGLSRRTLYRKLREYGLELGEKKGGE